MKAWQWTSCRCRDSSMQTQHHLVLTASHLKWALRSQGVRSAWKLGWGVYPRRGPCWHLGKILQPCPGSLVPGSMQHFSRSPFAHSSNLSNTPPTRLPPFLSHSSCSPSCFQGSPAKYATCPKSCLRLYSQGYKRRKPLSKAPTNRPLSRCLSQPPVSSQAHFSTSTK